MGVPGGHDRYRPGMEGLPSSDHEKTQRHPGCEGACGGGDGGRSGCIGDRDRRRPLQRSIMAVVVVALLSGWRWGNTKECNQVLPKKKIERRGETQEKREEILKSKHNPSSNLLFVIFSQLSGSSATFLFSIVQCIDDNFPRQRDFFMPS